MMVQQYYEAKLSVTYFYSLLFFQNNRLKRARLRANPSPVYGNGLCTRLRQPHFPLGVPNAIIDVWWRRTRLLACGTSPGRPRPKCWYLPGS